MRVFQEKELGRLFKPAFASTKTDNGQVTIIGGSALFHGAPLLSLKVASRLVDMVYFSSPEPSLGEVAARLKGKLLSFIWVPWEEVGEYIKKSDAVLIGPGFLRFRSEKQKEACELHNDCGQEAHKTKKITESLLQKFPKKQWVIDAGSLQTMDPQYIPRNAILTPNRREFEILFKVKRQKDTLEESVKRLATKYRCIIVLKGPTTIVCSSTVCRAIKGGNAGLTKGGTGDVLAGLTVVLAAKNEPFFAACAANFLAKKAAEALYKKVGFAYSADDLAEKIPEVLGRYWR